MQKKAMLLALVWREEAVMAGGGYDPGLS